MMNIRGLEKQRNNLAHSCFGICPDDEDLLFAISIKHHALWQADILPKNVKGIVPPDSHEDLKKHLFVYKTADLKTLNNQMEQLWWDMFYFNGYLRNPTEPRRVAEFRKLFEFSRIQKRIELLKKDSQKK